MPPGQVTTSTRMLALSGGACVLALAFILLGARYLPMMDLPQHAAQIALWARLGRDSTLSSTYVLNWLTPDLGGYALGRLLSLVWPLRVALAIAVLTALVATPVVVARELRLRDADPLWAITLVPLGFTMVFYWGLFNFLVGIPLVVLFVGAAERQATTGRGTVGLLALGLLLLACHVLLIGFASGAVLLQRMPRWRTCWPIVAPWPLALAWFAAAHRGEPLAQQGIEWHLDWTRLVQLPREVGGMSGGVDALQVLATLLLLAAPFALGARPSRSLRRWLPCLLAVGLFFTLPFRAFGNACLYPRFAALVAPLAMLALDRAPRCLMPRARALVPVLALAALAAIGLRVRLFDLEARQIDGVLSQMQPGKSAVGLCYLPVGADVAAPAFEHLAMWYQADGGGVTEPSFANRYPMLVRYRPGVAHFEPEWDPHTFRAERDARFDYYVVRAPVDIGPMIFPHGEARLAARSGLYWLYER